jgi:hypothetical protein
MRISVKKRRAAGIVRVGKTATRDFRRLSKPERFGSKSPSGSDTRKLSCLFGLRQFRARSTPPVFKVCAPRAPDRFSRRLDSSNTDFAKEAEPPRVQVQHL